MLALFVLLAVSAVLLFVCLWQRRNLYFCAVYLPGPPAVLPLVGNGFSFLCRIEDLLERMLTISKLYPSPFRLWIGPKLVVFIKDPDQLQIVMQSSKISTKAFVYRFLEPFMGKGLFTSSDILVEDKNEHAIDYKDMPGYVRRFYQIFTQRVISFWLYPDLLFKLTSLFKEQREMVKVATTITDDVTNKRIPEIEKRLRGYIENQHEVEKRTPSVLEMMSELVRDNPDCLSPTEFRDHMMTFVATDKVLQEIHEVLGDRKSVYFEDTGKLKYMEMCIKESMRLFPLGPFLPRDVLEDFKIGKYTIPKGCSLILGVYNVHRDPKYWKRPEEYYPEHFDAENSANRHPYAFLPFSAGPRRCIAQQYSYVNMKIIVANILMNFEIDCPGTLKELQLMTDVSIRPRHGYMVQIKRRESVKI